MAAHVQPIACDSKCLWNLIAMCQETEGVAEKRLIVGNVLDTVVPSIVVAYLNVRRLEWDVACCARTKSDLPSERRVRVTIHAQKLEARGSVNWQCLQAQKRRKREDRQMPLSLSGCHRPAPTVYAPCCAPEIM
jgi:hypothetical protein